MGNCVSSLDAIRILRGVQKEMKKNGTVDFDGALMVCFFAGRFEMVRQARVKTMTISRSTIIAALNEGVARFRRGQIPINWEDEWRKLRQPPPARKIATVYKLY